MQPSFQQSAATAHIDDLVHAARSYRLASHDRRGISRRLISLGAVRSALTPSMRKAQHA
jgi:hypothetical protein